MHTYTHIHTRTHTHTHAHHTHAHTHTHIGLCDNGKIYILNDDNALQNYLDDDN